MFKKEILVLSLALSAGCFVSSAQASGEAFELVSRNPVNNVVSAGRYAAVSADGRYIAFEGSSADLVSPSLGSGTLQQIFLFDRRLNKTEAISIDNSGKPATKEPGYPVISGDGCKVAFVNSLNIFVRDRCAQPPVTIRVGESISTNNGYNSHRNPDISADGRYVAFEDSENIYLHDIAANSTILISADTSGAKAGGRQPAISADGSRIAFWSDSSKLVSGDTNGLWDIFLWDRTTKKITRVSTSAAGTARKTDPGIGISTIVPPAISGNGRYVAFASSSSHLTGSSNEKIQLIIKDIQTGEIKIASSSSSGVIGNDDFGYSERPSLSSDGQWVLFTTTSKNIVSGAVNSNYLALYNNFTGKTTGIRHDISDRFGASYRPVMSSDGRYVVVNYGEKLDPRFEDTGFFLHDRVARCLFDGFEDAVPAYLSPSRQTTNIAWLPPHVVYRHYSGTKSYMAIVNDNDNLYYIGANGQPLSLGPVNNWLTSSGDKSAPVHFNCP